MGLGTRRCGAGVPGAGRAARGSAGCDEGGGKEGGGRGRAPAGRGGSRRGWRSAGVEGAWDSHAGPRGGDGEESEQQRPRVSGVLTLLRGRRPLPGACRAVQGSRSRRVVPASLSPPPAGPSPAPPGRPPPRGPGRSLCKRGPSKTLVSLPNRSAYLGTGPLCPLGDRERNRNRAGGQDKEAETITEMGTGENRRERALRRTAVHPLPVVAKGEEKSVAP